MEDLPDISHLTPEERRIIEEVVIRQKREEEKENEIMRRKQDEVQVLEETIRARSEKHKKAGVELNATCQVCMKTKFADGIGHNCNYCHIRCCARCGAKITLRSRREIWVCIVCRKKQEVLTMTKAGLGTVDNAMLPMRMQEDMQVGGPPGLLDQTQDKRPKLERAHSAAEKENLPLLQRSGSLLKRQYSQQEQVPRRVSTSDSGVEMSVSPHSRSLPTPQVVGSYPIPKSLRHHTFGPDETSLFRSEIDGLMREHQKNYPRHRPIYQDQNSDFAMAYGQPGTETGPSRGPVHPSQQHTVVHQAQGTHPSQSAVAGQSTLQQQRSYSSSEEERSTPECGSDEPDESEKGKEYYPKMDGPMAVSKDTRTKKNATHNGQLSITSTINIEFNGNHQPREPRKELNTIVRRSFRRNGDEWRADSRRFTERRGKKTVRFYGGTNIGRHQEDDWSWEVADHCRQGSQDSATKDSGIDTSSTFTSSEESNRGELPKHPLSWQVSRDGQKVIGHMVLRKSLGSETGTSILGLKVVGGILLEDGSRGAVIEKVKKGSTADVDGHLRPGDEVLEWNNRSLQGRSFKDVYEIIAESRQESQVELIVSRNLSAALAPSTTTMTTSTIMVGQQQQQQKQLQQQQLHQQRLPVTSMSVPSRRITSQTQWRTKQDSISSPQQPHHKDYMIFRIPGLKKCILWELYDARREKPSVLVTSPGSPDLNAQGRVRHGRRATTGNVNVGGDLQVKLAFDPVALQLLVTVICASALSPRPDGQPRNPYAKIFLLPDRSEKSKRRTKTLANTNDPKWNQTFVYNGIRSSELRKRALEITVWDYGRYDANDFLGEVVIELAVAPLDDEIEWHPLTIHAEHRHYQEAEDMVITPVDCHLSPPSTTSRLSDSDTSECDITDCDVSREQRRTADGASISSIGSSSRFHNMPSNYKRHYSSPPPERELCVDGEHRSRRDMSPQGRKRAALMVSRDHPASISGYQTYRKDDIHRGMMGHRSHSAAPMDSPSVRYRGRSQSPTGHRSLSPPEHRSMPYSHSYMPRFGSRSATATPTGSPKKRQLPQIPAALKDRVTHDFEDRAKFMRHRNRPGHTTYRSTGMGGWERHYSGLSDSDLPSMGHDPLSLPHSNAHRLHRPRRGHLSPDKDVLGDLGDSDMESIASVTSSAFSTQSERPRGSRGLILFDSQTATSDTAKNYHPRADDHQHENPRTIAKPTSTQYHQQQYQQQQQQQQHQHQQHQQLQQHQQHQQHQPHHRHHQHRQTNHEPRSSSSSSPPPPPPLPHPHPHPPPSLSSSSSCQCCAHPPPFIHNNNTVDYVAANNYYPSNRRHDHDNDFPMTSHRRTAHHRKILTYHDAGGDADGTVNVIIDDGDVLDGDVVDHRRRRYDDDDLRDRRSSSMPESSEYSGQSGSYEKPTRHQTTDNGHDEQHTGKRGQFIRSLSNTDAPPDEKVDGSLSDTAVSHVDDASRRDRKSSPGSKSGSGSSSGGGSAVQYQTGLGKKSNSTSQLSATGGTCVGEEGRKRRLGFGKKGKSSFTVHRSEEVLPEDTASGRSGRQASSASSDGEGSGDGDSWSPSLRLASETGQLRDFIEDLGPAQVVGRQALGAGHLGAIQLSLSNTKGYLEVEIIRAKDLKSKIGSKAIPASYVKVYLMNGKKCIEKAKTSTARRTLDPFYQESLAFRENYRGCILQITVWGDYGRFEGKKVFMGLAQIVLDDLNLNQMVFGWYKLFDATLLVSGPSTLALSRRSSATSLESLKSLRIDEVSSERETEEKRSARFLDVDER
ncbi:PREDICTED: regulating synaptic membrane exocytosis protein 2 isoform X3 [Polistes canadensis]|uniref:regulating synaptic membrane exocytosis protein 2 isoform X3 n=1 Tax=Polistes canadensis TaxID=91411 RepID=UPI000718D7C4|nr:PREDICTED: regulating synaptic membrane exocytosis protein 2 isoform X3 [Polistes canadensis]